MPDGSWGGRAFYNNEAPPFGGAGNKIRFGACSQGQLRRGGLHLGLPWQAGYTSAGVTLAHADDVKTKALRAGYQNQRARQVNDFAMPWECLFCPVRSPSPTAASGARIAPLRWMIQELLHPLSDGRPDFDWNFRGTQGFTTDGPSWARTLLDGSQLQPEDSRPPASYLFVSDMSREGRGE